MGVEPNHNSALTYPWCPEQVVLMLPCICCALQHLDGHYKKGHHPAPCQDPSSLCLPT